MWSFSCCLSCLFMNTCGHICSLLHSSQEGHWLSLPINDSAGAVLIRELSPILLHDQAAVGVSQDGYPYLILGSSPNMCVLILTLPGHAAAARNHQSPLCVIPPKLTLSLHRCCQRPYLNTTPKQLVQKEHSVNLVCQKAKKIRHVFDWIHAKVGLLYF